MNAMSNFQTIVDIGFIALVTISCCRALMLAQSPRNEHDIAQRTAQWQSELQQVEGVLRRLVSDATSAGQTLDRQLSRRHEELSALVRRIDQHRAQQSGYFDDNVPVELADIANENAISAVAAQDLMDDLPNSSWHRGSTPKPSNAKSLKEEILEKLPAETAKRVSSRLSSMIEVEEQQQAAKPSSHEHLIARLPFALGVSMLTNPDATAYKVAARLLANGKEIHVVSRKLGLPIHEVRALDKLLREDAGEEPDIRSEDSLAEQQPSTDANRISWTLGDEADDEAAAPLFARDVSLL